MRPLDDRDRVNLHIAQARDSTQDARLPYSRRHISEPLGTDGQLPGGQKRNVHSYTSCSVREMISSCVARLSWVK